MGVNYGCNKVRFPSPVHGREQAARRRRPWPRSRTWPAASRSCSTSPSRARARPSPAASPRWSTATTPDRPARGDPAAACRRTPRSAPPSDARAPTMRAITPRVGAWRCGSSSCRRRPTCRWTPSATTSARGCWRRPDARAASPGTATSTSTGWHRIRDPAAAGLHPGHHRPPGHRRARRRRRGAARPAVGAAPAGTDGRRPDAPDRCAGAAGGDGRRTVHRSTSWPTATGMPLALLKALEAEGLLIPTRVAGQDRYTDEDVAASQAGLRLLEWGIPLTDLLDLARRHNEATEAMARQAVELFARHVREPLRHGARPDALAHPSTPPAPWPAHRRPGRRRTAAGLRRAAPGGQHPGRPPLHPDPGQGRPRPRRAGRAPTRSGEAVWDRIRADGDVLAGAATPRGRRRDRTRRRGPDDPSGGTRSAGDLPRGRGPGPRGRPAHRRGQDRAGAVDVRRHRPPLRPGQPHDDLRARRPVAQAVAAGPRPARRARPCSTWPAAPATSSAPARPAATAPFGMDLSWGMLAANRTGLPLAQADGAAPAGGRPAPSTGSPAATPCATSPSSAAVFDEFGRIVRPGGRISLLEVSEPDRGPPARRAPHLVPPGGPGHRRPAVGPVRLPVPARSRPPTCRPPTSCGPCWSRPGSRPSTAAPCRVA